MELLRREPFVLDPQADPVAQAGELRALGPLVAVELPGGVVAWTATDLVTAQQVLGHEDLTKDAALWPDLAEGRIPDDWELIALVRGAAMLHQGGADHRRLRHLVSSAFSRAPIEALRPRVEEIADELLDRAEAGGDGEVVDLWEQLRLAGPGAARRTGRRACPPPARTAAAAPSRRTRAPDIPREERPQAHPTSRRKEWSPQPPEKQGRKQQSRDPPRQAPQHTHVINRPRQTAPSPTRHRSRPVRGRPAQGLCRWTPLPYEQPSGARAVRGTARPCTGPAQKPMVVQTSTARRRTGC
ncbi:hypothetical protein [Streptomyces sp. NPDC018833]|uniref:hypothetical protein n=1 Tax=Streptomyces sp. NPDC018833 TaxID=3365053 RepID=UPI0037BDC71F